MYVCSARILLYPVCRFAELTLSTAHNNFQGELPPFLSRISSLESLDFSTSLRTLTLNLDLSSILTPLRPDSLGPSLVSMQVLTVSLGPFLAFMQT